MIDLHGQHVAEALRIVERALAQRRAQSAGRPRSTQILVGTAHHSKVSEASLPPMSSSLVVCRTGVPAC